MSVVSNVCERSSPEPRPDRIFVHILGQVDEHVIAQIGPCRAATILGRCRCESTAAHSRTNPSCAKLPRGEGRFVTSVLSIQSSVAYGYVGNAAAVPVLQRLGIEAWPVHTAVLS